MSKWGQLMDATNSSNHQFTGNITGKRHGVAVQISKNSTPYSVFRLYFAAVITLMVKETN
jgi:hypothetical protein